MLPAKARWIILTVFGCVFLGVVFRLVSLAMEYLQKLLTHAYPQKRAPVG